MKNQKERNNYLFGVIAVNVLWYIFSLIINKPILPSPIKVYKELFIIFPSTILVHVLYSLGRIIGGILISLLIGIPIGILMGYFSSIDMILAPIIYFTYPIPKISLLPVVMLIFGLGEMSKILMIVIIVMFQLIVSTRDAVSSIPKEIYHSMFSLGANKIQIFKNVIIPAITGEIFSAIRITIGTSLSILFFTETFGTEYGLGYFIMDSWMRINYIQMFSGIVVLAILGFMLFLIIDILERKICIWK